MIRFFRRAGRKRAWRRPRWQVGPVEALEARRLLTAALVFEAPVSIAQLADQASVVSTTADLNGDSRLDLIVGESVSGRVRVAFASESGFTTTDTSLTAVGLTSIEAADIDRDGHVDLVLSKSDGTNATVQWFRNLGLNGDQWLGFDPPVQVASGAGAVQLLIDDFDADGNLDLASAGSQRISIRQGLGNGAFGDPIDYLEENGTRSLVAQDLDMDGDLDLAVVNANRAEVAVLLGSGDGTFEEHDQRYKLAPGNDSPGLGRWLITGGDVDADGDLDLIVGHNYSMGENLSILLSNGDGSFSPDPVRDTVPGTPLAIVVGDVDADGDLDLAVAHSGTFHHPVYGNSSGGLSLLLGAGTPYFAKPWRVFANYNSNIVDLKDLNRDNRLDVITTIQQPDGSTSVSYMLASADERFGLEPANFAAGYQPNRVAVGDLNRDGHDDLVVTNEYSQDVSVMLGQGDATFSQFPSHPTGNRPTGQVAADFNGDGKIDLATANSGSNDVSVLINQGEGVFLPERRYAVGTSPRFVTAADLDADGDLDLAVSNQYSHDVSVLLGAGDGTFAPESRFRTAANPNSIAVTDVNDDGRVDLLVSTQSSISVLQGYGDGAFEQEPRYKIGENNLSSQTIADFNRDGRDDLVAITAGSGRGPGGLVLWLSAADGSLILETSISVSGGINAVEAAEVNGDGFPDLIVSGYDFQTGNNRTTVLFGDGAAGFVEQPGFSGGYPLAHGDWNGDGRLDLAYSDGGLKVRMGNANGTFDKAQANVGSDLQLLKQADVDGDGHADLIGLDYTVNFPRIGIRLGRGDGTFDKPFNLPATGALRFGVATFGIGDWDGDADADLAVIYGSNSPGSLAILESNGDGTFTERETFRLPPNTSGIVVADWNEDSLPDLGVTSGSDQVSVFTSNGDGTVRPHAPFAAGDGISSGLAGDFNGDGHQDLSLLNWGTGAASIVLGHGNGSFDAPNRLLAGVSPDSLQAADLNGDGRTDLVAVNRYSSRVTILMREANGSFAPPVSHTISFDVTLAALRDLNGDGVLDLITASQNSTVSQSSIDVSMGLGDGTFARRTSYKSIAGINGLSVVDLNADGWLDVAASSPLGVAVHFGNAAGVLGPITRYSVGNGASSLVAADLDGDGDVDLSVVNQNADSVSVVAGEGDGTFASEPRYGVGMGPSAVQLEDINADGYLDVLVANTASGDISILLGNGDGTLRAESRLKVGAYLQSLAVGDFDQDGHFDLAIVTDPNQQASVYVGNGDGTFVLQKKYPIGEGAGVVLSEDLNGDMNLDLIAINSWWPASISVLLGNDDGTLGTRKSYSVGGDDATAATTGDFNGDGHIDVAIVLASAHQLSVLLGKGDGSFQSAVTYSLADYPSAVMTLDVNRDGILDLTASLGQGYCWNSCGAGGFAILIGRGDGTFEPSLNYFLTSGGFRGLAAADVDADGDLDLTLTHPGGVKIVFNNTHQASDRIIADVNGDGQFDSSDLVIVLAAGEYDDGVLHNSTFDEGDWNGDGDFDSSDLVLAFQQGHYQFAARLPFNG